jgi:hypothetical protein
MMSDVELPVAHVREQVASAIDVIVHMARLRDGRRVVLEVAAVDGVRDGEPIVTPLFRFRPRSGAHGGFDSAWLLSPRSLRPNPLVLSDRQPRPDRLAWARLVRRLGIAAVARELGVTPQSVQERVRRIEKGEEVMTTRIEATKALVAELKPISVRAGRLAARQGWTSRGTAGKRRSPARASCRAGSRTWWRRLTTTSGRLSPSWRSSPTGKTAMSAE